MNQLNEWSFEQLLYVACSKFAICLNNNLYYSAKVYNTPIPQNLLCKNF